MIKIIIYQLKIYLNIKKSKLLRSSNGKLKINLNERQVSKA